MTDLVVAMTLGALTAYQLINVTPSGAPISGLPLALIPTVDVPLLFALHISAVSALIRDGLPGRVAFAPNGRAPALDSGVPERRDHVVGG
jgi:hypothetical protein